MRVIYGPQVLHEVALLIDNAAKGTRLRLVSGYFDPQELLGRSIDIALERGVQMTLIVRGGRSAARHRRAVGTFDQSRMTVRYLPWLHAKLYVSETQAIAASMNLTENRNANAGDMAVSVRRLENPDVHQQMCDAFAYFERKSSADDLERNETLSTDGTRPRAKSAQRNGNEAGHCIRCGEGILLNPEKPLCRSCYEEWAEYENGAYEESFCHRCGAEAETSFDKPLCRPCWAAT